MKVFLMRHGDAQTGADDAKRQLSEEGRGEAGVAGEFLRRAGEAPGAIFHSGLRRSMETAMIVSEKLGSGTKLSLRKGLLPDDNVPEFADGLIETLFSPVGFDESGGVMIVGHQPFVSSLAAFLLTGEEGGLSLKFPTGTLACFELSGSLSAMPFCSLRFHVTAKLMNRLLGA
ncbi:MAG: phosphohistidine phosphatase SixA [Synergistaceae bacterium]|jgi:phosphohistidine phosphatase|nr:phosphohistidine phosphatase SixA [Synergistaceae bacterium]